MMVQQPNNKTILTVTGSDSTSGSGVQADIKMISSLGGYAVSAITSITVQNTIGIQNFYDIPPEIVSGQIEAIVNDVQPRVVKVGMIRRCDTLDLVASTLRRYSPLLVIYDPVIMSSRNDILMPEDVMDRIKQCLLPLCTMVTIKKSNAEYLLGERITSGQDMLRAANKILDYGCDAVLLQGGVLMTGASTDVLVMRNVDEPIFLSSPDIACLMPERHGMSGNISSAIAYFLSCEHDIPDAVTLAYNYINQLLVTHTDLVGRSGELYNEFVSEVAAHYQTNSDVRFYADRLNVSSRYLAQVTKRIAGKAPKMIIDDYIKQEAELLITSSDMTIQEIAYSLGFSSQAHFAKFFRKMTNTTPSEYKKNNQKQIL
ncbi:MAG: bifunctional hydroxymethylpyrimidine kinase/phosphomethylpyrimidine kinase [Prevotella sp.]